jgi:hypothetical protein
MLPFQNSIFFSWAVCVFLRAQTFLSLGGLAAFQGRVLAGKIIGYIVTDT